MSLLLGACSSLVKEGISKVVRVREVVTVMTVMTVVAWRAFGSIGMMRSLRVECSLSCFLPCHSSTMVVNTSASFCSFFCRFILHSHFQVGALRKLQADMVTISLMLEAQLLQELHSRIFLASSTAVAAVAATAAAGGGSSGGYGGSSGSRLGPSVRETGSSASKVRGSVGGVLRYWQQLWWSVLVVGMSAT